MRELMTDIAIIGAGTAGMTAAVYAARAGKRVLVLEQESFGGQIVYASRVENYPGIQQISGAEFAANLTEQVLSLGAELEMETVEGVRPIDGGFCLVTDGREITCKSVILATGVRHRPLGIEREEELAGQGVSYCAVCDGAFYKGQEVAVVGGGNTALEDALFLSSYCSKVLLVHRRDTFRAEQRLVERARGKENIEFVLSAVVNRLEGEDSLAGIELRFDDGQKAHRRVAGLFVAVGQIPQNERFADLVALDEAGYITAGEDCKTSRPGVFAAGDCRRKQIRQLSTAAADGAVAALAACEYCD